MSEVTASTLETARFPIGRYRPPAKIDAEQRRPWIEEIKQLPTKLRNAVAGLDDEQLDTSYREGGWTVRQIVHHLPDSHLNSYIRFRLALTEESPTIKTYREEAWAELADAKSAPIELSLQLLHSLHARWSMLLESMTEKDYARTFEHPESGPMTLSYTLGLYAWHGRHHVAHILSLHSR